MVVLGTLEAPVIISRLQALSSRPKQMHMVEAHILTDKYTWLKPLLEGMLSLTKLMRMAETTVLSHTG
jgi:hypothetical protein